MSELLSPSETPKARWIVFSTNNGAPFTTFVPADFKHLLDDIRQPSTLSTAVRWQLGRTVFNPNFNTGSGFEGHLAAYDRTEIKQLLHDLQDRGYSVARHVFGPYSYRTKINNLLKNCAAELDWKTILEFREIMDTVIRCAQAIRSMSLRGYGFKDNEKIAFSGSRVQRVNGIYNAVYLAATPNLISTTLEPDGRDLIFTQSFGSPKSVYRIDKEPVGGDLGNNPDLKFLAELGRFGSYIVPLIRQIKYS